MKKLLNGGAATVEDQDEVKCVCLCVYCMHVVPCAVIMLHNNNDIVCECVSVCWCFYRHSGSSLFIFLPWYIPNIRMHSSGEGN